MDKKNWDVWTNLAFKTQGYRKNFDLITENENIITEYNGIISILNMVERKPPLIIGEFGFSVWNISLGKMLRIGLNKLIRMHKIENTYNELLKLMNEGKFNIKNYDRILFIHGLILHPNYKKMEVTEEFVEMIYRDFYANNIAVIALVKPIQDNEIDADFYFRQKMVHVKKLLSGSIIDYDVVPAMEYYGLNKLIEKRDIEANEYRLFSVAVRCGFERIEDSNLFLYNPGKTINRIKEKKEILDKLVKK